MNREPTAAERAAIGDIPEKYCRVISSSEHGDYAYVLLNTNSDGQPHPYGVFCQREDGRWWEGDGSSGNSAGFLEGMDGKGYLAWWDEAPVGADAVRLALADAVHEVPVNDGFYLLVLWEVENPFLVPQLVAHHRDGRWYERSASELRKEARAWRRMEVFMDRLTGDEDAP